MTERGGSFWGVPSPQRGELRKFAALMGGVAALIAAYSHYGGNSLGLYIAGGVAVFFALSLAFPAGLRPLYIGWMLLARILSFVNTHLLLALVFYLLFTPIGLVMRLLGRDPLERERSAEAPTYWQRRRQSLLGRDHYRRQF